MNKILKILEKWRKDSFFPSISDIEWRHAELSERLVHIQNFQKNHYITMLETQSELQRSIIEVLALLQPTTILDYQKIRMGREGDGGYIQLNDFAGINLALSFGINNDDSWDLDVIKRKIPVQQYDYSIDEPPSRHPLLTFHKKRVGANNDNNCVTLQEIIEAHVDDGAPNILLKIDIEGSEWDVLDACDEAQLQRIGQIICEFHGLSNLIEVGFYTRAKRVLEKINRVFISHHVHGNNRGSIVNIGNVPFPDVLEVSYANRRLYQASKTYEIYPTSLDRANNPELSDLFLGTFQFRNDM